MSNASHAEKSESRTETRVSDRDGPSTLGRAATRYRTAASDNPIEFGIRIVAGVIGLLLFVLTVQHVTQPPLAAKTVELLQSATGQWLAVALLAVLLLLGAIRGGAL